MLTLYGLQQTESLAPLRPELFSWYLLVASVNLRWVSPQFTVICTSPEARTAFFFNVCVAVRGRGGVNMHIYSSTFSLVAFSRHCQTEIYFTAQSQQSLLYLTLKVLFSNYNFFLKYGHNLKNGFTVYVDAIQFSCDILCLMQVIIYMYMRKFWRFSRGDFGYQIIGKTEKIEMSLCFLSSKAQKIRQKKKKPKKEELICLDCEPEPAHLHAAASQQTVV